MGLLGFSFPNSTKTIVEEKDTTPKLERRAKETSEVRNFPFVLGSWNVEGVLVADLRRQWQP